MSNSSSSLPTSSTPLDTLLTVQRVRLTGINPVTFQHPLDRQATEQLTKISGFDKVAAKFLDYGFERLDYVLNISSAVQVSERQFPRLLALLKECCAILDVPQPELFVAQGGANAITSGHTRPHILLMTGLIDLMTDEELMAVMAHEVGHIKCKHVLYQMMARMVGQIGEIAGTLTLGIGDLVSMGIESGLQFWARRAELSADRAMLLVMQDARPCISTLMKLAGGTSRFANQLDPEVFLQQARNYGEDMDRSNVSKIYRLVASLYKGDHPFVIERAKHLNDWVDLRDFENILNGNYVRVAMPTVQIVSGYCTKCGSPVQANFKFCGSCGNTIEQPTT